VTDEVKREMAYAPGRPENQPEEGAVVIIADGTMAHEITKYRTHAVLLVARSDIRYLGFTIGEVSLALSSRLRIPRYEVRVTRHRPEDFLVLFDFPPQRDMVVRAGVVHVCRVDSDILSWMEFERGRV
jgi:hypothetical protein